MNRRGFLGALIAAGAAAALDPDELLWTPGRKLISIPRVLPKQPLWYLHITYGAGRGQTIQMYEYHAALPAGFPSHAILSVELANPTNDPITVQWTA